MTSNRVIDPELERIADEISASNRPVSDMVEVIERVFSENINAQALRLLVTPATNDAESPGTWMCRVRKTALLAVLASTRK